MKETVKGRVPDADAPKGVPTAEKLVDGQYADHFVLSEEDLAKGYVRPYREQYRHVGIGPEYPCRDLTEEEKERYSGLGYVCFEIYPEGSNAKGRFWSQAELDSGCGGVTIMPVKCAKTYAANPRFYGRTFCCHCKDYFPVKQFVWLDDGSRVGN